MSILIWEVELEMRQYIFRLKSRFVLSTSMHIVKWDDKIIIDDKQQSCVAREK